MSNDRSYLELLQDYYAQHRALPSYASIGHLLGLKSKSSVAAMVARLKLAGYLDSTPDKRLAPTGRFFARPLAESGTSRHAQRGGRRRRRRPSTIT
jgi:repressor LexA